MEKHKTQHSVGLEALECFSLNRVSGQCPTSAKKPVYSFNTFLPHFLQEMLHSLSVPKGLIPFEHKI